jgi:hypothetical protein
MYLPQEPMIDEDTLVEKPTTKVLPVTVRITAPSKYRVKNGRALVAVLRCLQKVDPITYIAPTSDSYQKNNILHPAKIPPDEDRLSYYMEDPSTNKYKTYSVRIHIRSNLDLDTYKKIKKLLISSVVKAYR